MKAFLSKNENESGIYKIINILNGRIYIGKAKNFLKRFKGHKRKLFSGKHHNSFLQNDFIKCGDAAFEFHILEIVSDYKDCSQEEDKWISEYYDYQVKCYNFIKKSNALPRSVFSNDPEYTKNLLSQKGKEQWADPEIRSRRLETVRSPEFRKKQSENQKKVSQNPEFGNSAAAAKKRMSNQKNKEKLSKKLKKAWARDVSGERKKKASELAKIVYAANKEKIRDARVKAKSKYHGKVSSPEGVIFDVYNLENFCRIHGIKSPTAFWSLMNKRKRGSKYCGWEKIYT